MAFKTGDHVDIFMVNQYYGRGIVVSTKNDGMIVETYDNLRYSCAEEDLELVES